MANPFFGQDLKAQLRSRSAQFTTPLNFFLFGKPGVGKSSLINTFVHIYGGEYAKTGPMGTEGGASSVTVAYKSHPLPKMKICFWDTWGFNPDENNYDPVSFRSFLAGEVAEGEKKPTSSSNFISSKSSNQQANQIHGVFFFFNAQNDTTFEALWEQMRPYYHHSVYLKVPVYFLLCQLDQVEGIGPSITYSSLPANKEWIRLNKKMCEVLGKDNLNAPTILPSVCYQSPQAIESPAIEEFALRILQQAMPTPQLEKAILWNNEKQFENEKPIIAQSDNN